MGVALCERFPEAAAVYAEADDALDFNLSTLMKEGPDARLAETENTQPAILTCSVAYLRVLEKFGVTAEFAAGHSLGEYAALVANGALDFRTAVRLVRLRGRYMQDAVPLGVGTMTAVLMLDNPVVERLCEEASTEDSRVEVAGYNRPGQVSCAGHVDAVERLENLVAKANGTTKRLNVSAPFHSSLLSRAAEQLAEALAEVEFATPRFPYVANVDAELVTDAAGIRDRLVEQVVKAVRWEQSVLKMKEAGVDYFIEVGPGKTLVGLIRKIDRKLNAVCADDPKSLESLIGP
jgi:[acyl-carrier-protein] S-malonyltransferase